MRWPLIIAALFAAGCSISGVYRNGETFWHETIELNANGTFAYEYWEDDGGTVCIARGTWVVNEGIGTDQLITTITSLSPQGIKSCYLAEVEQWHKQGRSLRASNGRRFAYARGS